MREANEMREVRNSDGRLVCKVDERTGAVEISIKGCVTLIERTEDGRIKVVHRK
jgi:hypothetical protein